MSAIDKIKELFTSAGGLIYTAASDGNPSTLSDLTGNTIATSDNNQFWHVTGYAGVIAYSVPDGSTDCLVFPHSDEIQVMPVIDGDAPEELNVVTSDDSDISVYNSLPGISDTLETESRYALADAVINEATSKLKAPLEDINTSETILEGILRILNEEVVEAPQLRYFIQALEGEKDTILGEINAYRDAHARIMTNWWSTLIAADPSHSSLALRATFDMDTLGNLNESSYVSWWHDNVLPWLKQHGEFFNHEMVEAQTQAILSEVSMQQAQTATKH